METVSSNLKNILKPIFIKLVRFLENNSDLYVVRGTYNNAVVNPVLGVRSSQTHSERLSRVMPPHEMWFWGLDQTRYATAQLLSKEIYEHKVEGSIAEVGVYKGVFASVLNHFFADRKIYLFDTFEGFDSRDLNADEGLGFNITKYYDFKDCAIDSVLSIMPYQENVVIQKGWFPDSAKGCEDEKFCFVSLDADLYKPIYEGLHWFYPRLENGGYIIVNDYNGDVYPGAKQAVRDFSQEMGISYVAIPDYAGSVVIAKPLLK